VPQCYILNLKRLALSVPQIGRAQILKLGHVIVTTLPFWTPNIHIWNDRFLRLTTKFHASRSVVCLINDAFNVPYKQVCRAQLCYAMWRVHLSVDSSVTCWYWLENNNRIDHAVFADEYHWDFFDKSTDNQANRQTGIDRQHRGQTELRWKRAERNAVYPSLWNTLPVHLKNRNLNLTTFMRHLKSHLFSQYWFRIERVWGVIT